MRRRAFITLLGGAAMWPRVVGAQQPAIPVVGYLYVGAAEASASHVAAFRKGLGETGYVEGRNVAIEFRFAQSEFDRLPELAADLVRRRVAVIATPASAAATRAAKTATATIPIVFSTGADPVRTGLVASLNRPGGSAAFGERAIEIDCGRPMVHRQRGELHEAAVEQRVGTDKDCVGPYLHQGRRQCLCRDWCWRGGLRLAAQGPKPPPARRGSSAHGIYTGRILKGEKPADMPVLRATKFEFVINLHAAKLLGLTVPPTLLSRADEVIE